MLKLFASRNRRLQSVGLNEELCVTLIKLSKNKCLFWHHWQQYSSTGKTSYFICKKCGSRKAVQIIGGYQPIDWNFLNIETTLTLDKTQIIKLPMDNINPCRIQRRRTKGFSLQKASPNGLPVVYVGRGSKFGNAFTVEQYGREKAVQMFRDYIGHPNSPHGFEPEEITQLKGKNLACWCREDQPCHADVLLELANT